MKTQTNKTMKIEGLKTVYYQHVEAKNLVSAIDELYQHGRIVDSVELESDLGLVKIKFYQYSEFLQSIYNKAIK